MNSPDFLTTDKEVGKRVNLRALAKDTGEYHQLTLEQRLEMVEEFDKIKSFGLRKPPNVTARTRLAEVNNSFAAMVSEVRPILGNISLGSKSHCLLQAEALKERVGTETLIVTVRSSHNINMLPKVHLTSDVVSHFVRTLLREDPMKLGIKMESAVLAGLTSRSSNSILFIEYFQFTNSFSF